MNRTWDIPPEGACDRTSRGRPCDAGCDFGKARSLTNSRTNLVRFFLLALAAALFTVFLNGCAFLDYINHGQHGPGA